jgi:hypothetical protein
MLPPLRPDLIPRSAADRLLRSKPDDQREARLRAEEQRLETEREEFETEKAAHVEALAREIGSDRDRGQVVSNPAGVARLIAQAGESRRTGANTIELPSGGIARAICLSAMRRRGEVLDARDEVWLQNYCRRIDADRNRE